MIRTEPLRKLSGVCLLAITFTCAAGPCDDITGKRELVCHRIWYTLWIKKECREEYCYKFNTIECGFGVFSLDCHGDVTALNSSGSQVKCVASWSQGGFGYLHSTNTTKCFKNKESFSPG